MMLRNIKCKEQARNFLMKYQQPKVLLVFGQTLFRLNHQQLRDIKGTGERKPIHIEAFPSQLLHFEKT